MLKFYYLYINNKIIYYKLILKYKTKKNKNIIYYINTI